MLSGIGFDAKVAHDFSTKASRGLLTYTTQSLIHFFKAQPYQFEVTIDNFSFFTDAFLSALPIATNLATMLLLPHMLV
jgi:diacylglycerol kinase family enzyme